MIQNKSVAAEISALMVEIGGLINRSLVSVKGRVSAGEFKRYRAACDMVLMDILMEILSPIQDLHPELLDKDAAEEDDRENYATDPRPDLNARAAAARER